MLLQGIGGCVGGGRAGHQAGCAAALSGQLGGKPVAHQVGVGVATEAGVHIAPEILQRKGGNLGFGKQRLVDPGIRAGQADQHRIGMVLCKLAARGGAQAVGLMLDGAGVEALRAQQTERGLAGNQREFYAGGL